VNQSAVKQRIGTPAFAPQHSNFPTDGNFCFRSPERIAARNFLRLSHRNPWRSGLPMAGLFISERTDSSTMRVSRLDIDTGKRQLVREWMPADRSGVIGYESAGISSDGKSIVYSYTRVLGDVYLVDGLK